jgi:hypothetical protein
LSSADYLNQQFNKILRGFFPTSHLTLLPVLAITVMQFIDILRDTKGYLVEGKYNV